MMRPSRQRVSTGSPFEPKVGISRAVRSGSIIAVTGTAPLGPDGKTVAKGDATGQARRCLQIIQSAIEGLGGKLSDVTRTRILLTRIEDWERVATVHGEFFGSMAGVVHNHDAAMKDEAPPAYKDIHRVMRAQKDLVKVIHELRPMLSIKGR